MAQYYCLGRAAESSGTYNPTSQTEGLNKGILIVGIRMTFHFETNDMVIPFDKTHTIDYYLA